MSNRPRWRWGLTIYLALLAASYVTQWRSTFYRPPPPNRQTATITLDSRSIRIAYAFASRSSAPPHAVNDHGRPAPPTILLLHGSPGSADNFRHLIPLLLPHAHVLAVDLPGFGYSQRRLDDYGIDAQARAVLALLEELQIQRVHVLGFSMGSGVALHLADLAPQRIASLIFYGGIGLQEHEGSGDYHFEHLKYRIGYAALVVAPELVPHFGLLGSYDARRAFIRNFMDTDQRLLRGLLNHLNVTSIPLLLLQGRDDPLVPADAAYAHHDLVRHSELVMFNDSHFMLCDVRKCISLAAEISPFIERAEMGQVQRRTVDDADQRPAAKTILPIGVDLKALSPWTQMAAIILSSYVLEDPTTVLAGLLVKQGRLDWFVTLLAVFVGIFSGDLGLYAVGWFAGRRALRWRPVSRRLPVHQVEALGRWFDTHGWTAVLASRFIPGTRLPLYIAAGALGKKPFRFAMWTCLAVAIWAPAMLLLVMVLGTAAVSPLHAIFGEHTWLAAITAIILLLAALRVLTLLLTSIGRARIIVAVSRWWRVEFWPAWLFYLPLVPWYAWLSIKHRSFTVWTLANPGIPHGGVVGESKYNILSRLDPVSIIPSARIESIEQLQQTCDDRGWALPLVLKPDAGQRGAGVKLIRTWDDAQRYFAVNLGPALAQTYHPGPHEAGVFYYRDPGEPHGHVLAITDKAFPVLIGDGRHSLEQLIWRHHRYRMQAAVFLQRHEQQRDRVLCDGEQFPLAMAGNHCQGTMFRDGSHLITEALREALDRAVSDFGGFHIGRFDLRYADAADLQAGRGLGIVELNGVTSEATAIYDPDWPLIRRYRLLFRQWSLLFAIGARMRQLQQIKPIRWIDLLRLVRDYYRGRVVETVSD